MSLCRTGLHFGDLNSVSSSVRSFFFFFQAEDGIRDIGVTGVQTCALPIFAYKPLLPSHADASEEDAPAFARPTRALLGLGIISFCVLLGEGAMGDWSAVYLENTLDTGPGFAAAGYAAFSLSMAFGRLFGDRFMERLGPATVVRSCGVLAATGLGIALAVAQPLVAL